VWNPCSSLVITNGVTSAPATFIFATEEGQILAWTSSVSGGAAMEEATSAGAVYKGLAIAGNMLYATDFHHGRVDVFDGSFQPVDTAGAFVDPAIPAGYAPFGIQNVNGTIVVTYAKQDADQHDDVAGQGHGFVDMFSTTGTLLGRVATHAQ